LNIARKVREFNLGQALGLGDISLDELPSDAADRLRKLQMRGAIEQMRVFVIGNTFFAPVLSSQAWGTGVDGLVLAWTAAMLVFSWWLFWTWRTTYQTDGNAADMKRFANEPKLLLLDEPFGALGWSCSIRWWMETKKRS
jgi:hypothetical protein